MATLGEQVGRAIRNAGIPIKEVQIVDTTNRATWTVEPANLQSAAQPIIDAFDPGDPQHALDDLSGEVKVALDQQRLSSAIVWALLKQLFPADTAAQTKTKYGVARTRIIDSFKAQPWK